VVFKLLTLVSKSKIVRHEASELRGFRADRKAPKGRAEFRKPSMSGVATIDDLYGATNFEVYATMEPILPCTRLTYDGANDDVANERCPKLD
jgi:hypothetical protein